MVLSAVPFFLFITTVSVVDPETVGVKLAAQLLAFSVAAGEPPGLRIAIELISALTLVALPCVKSEKPTGEPARTLCAEALIPTLSPGARAISALDFATAVTGLQTAGMAATSQVWLAGLASTFSPSSIARAWNVWLPTARLL